MDHRGQRPPRSARPSLSHGQSSTPSPPSYPDQPPSSYSAYARSPAQPYDAPRPSVGTNISFGPTERGDRHEPLDQPGRVRGHSAYQNVLSPTSPDPEAGYAMPDAALVGRKKSMVRPDREKIEPGHRQWHYRSHAAQLEDEGSGNLVYPSSASLPPPFLSLSPPLPPCFLSPEIPIPYRLNFNLTPLLSDR